MRLNVYLPDRLAEEVRDSLPDVNVSAVLQDALRSVLGCTHTDLACVTCRTVERRRDIEVDVLRVYLRDLMWELQDLVDRHGTAEGAARVAKRVALDAGVDAAGLSVPRPPRGQVA